MSDSYGWDCRTDQEIARAERKAQREYAEAHKDDPPSERELKEREVKALERIAKAMEKNS